MDLFEERRVVRRLLPVLALAMACLSTTYAQQRPEVGRASAESRTALVIGNGNYPNAPLRNPLNDARAMARTLKELGFEVTLRTNLGQKGMVAALREFGANLREGGVALFYYSGHGMQVKGRNFLIPVDADIRGEDEVPYMAVDVSQVLDKIETARTRTNVVILDACRNNPFIRTFRSTRVGLAQMDAPAGTLIAFSTAPGSEARDGDEEYGVYTKHLLAQLAAPGVPVEIVFRRVREGVIAETTNRQVPWESSSLTGDFYFQAGIAPGIGATAGRQALQDEIERAVQAALTKREQEQAAAQAVRADREIQTAKAAIDRMNRELAELRAAREAEKMGTKGIAAQPPGSPRSKLAVAAPVSRPEPIVDTGGRAERPDVRVGDLWKYRVTDGYTNIRSEVVVEVAAVTENHIYTRSARSASPAAELAAAAGLVEVWNRDWNQLRQGETEFTPFYPAFQFPLETGKKWSGSVQFDIRFGRMNQQLAMHVAGWERVTVPAGTFDAVKVTVRGNFHMPAWSQVGAAPSGTLENSIWYAPAVRQVVKRDIAQQDSGGSRFENLSTLERWELVDYKPR